MDECREYSPSKIYIKFSSMSYNITHVVNMVNNNKRFHREWFEDCLLKPLLDGRVAFHPSHDAGKKPTIQTQNN